MQVLNQPPKLIKEPTGKKKKKTVHTRHGRVIFIEAEASRRENMEQTCWRAVTLISRRGVAVKSVGELQRRWQTAEDVDYWYLF